MRWNLDLGDIRAFYKGGHKKAHKGPLCLFVALFGNAYDLGGAFFQVGGEPFAVGIRYLVDLHAQLPFPARALAGTVRADDSDHDFDQSVRQLDSHKQLSSDLRQLRFGEPRSD